MDRINTNLIHGNFRRIPGTPKYRSNRGTRPHRSRTPIPSPSKHLPFLRAYVDGTVRLLTRHGIDQNTWQETHRNPMPLGGLGTRARIDILENEIKGRDKKKTPFSISEWS